MPKRLEPAVLCYWSNALSLGPGAGLLHLIMRLSLALIASGLSIVSSSGLTTANFQVYRNTIDLDFAYDGVIPAWWTRNNHVRRISHACNDAATRCYLAYLDNAKAGVHIQAYDPRTFKKAGPSIMIPKAIEASGIIAHNDGFAILTNLPNAHTKYAVVYLFKFVNGKELWRVALNGPGVHVKDGIFTTPDINGDLAYSKESDLYGAYFVTTAESGDYKGHFGDSIAYVKNGKLDPTVNGTMNWGCSHDTGIAFRATPSAPFCSVCSDDGQGLYLNTGGTGMFGVRVSNEHAVQGSEGEPFGGMGQGFSSLAAFSDGSFLLAWRSRGAINTKGTPLDKTWTVSDERWLHGNVAITKFSDKATLAGPVAPSQRGLKDADKNHGWLTYDESDHGNVHIHEFQDQSAIVYYETTYKPKCQPLPMECTGDVTKATWQLVDKSGKKIGNAVVRDDVWMYGDMVTVGKKVCWPFIEGRRDLSQPKEHGIPTKQLSMACISSGNDTLANLPVSSGVTSPPPVHPIALSGTKPYTDEAAAVVPEETPSAHVGNVAGDSPKSKSFHKRHRKHHHSRKTEKGHSF